MTTLANTAIPGLNTSLARQAITVLLGAALLTISAKVQVPFWPVPMTLQTLAVLLIGAALGWRLAGATVLTYLAQGAMGLPVFASGAGLAYMAGPTGGYLAGFLLGAVAVGWLCERGMGRSVGTTLIAFGAGLGLIYGLGVLWLTAFMGLGKAIAVGVTPFLPAEALKLALACILLPAAWKLVKRL
ncbi:biotin transporter BioY [Roseovarius faecimaris]|uniref:Biotin transporter n=1 Tax=Roseovarius faecimaris TaxID=2494550 RepID=A0A6I6IMQ7_9RHOB|nr:biotin transporter BioY [Roseovarius faecimaris]QGX97073.1 biotin transporter BioY [Roseovarius faecimaris]